MTMEAGASTNPGSPIDRRAALRAQFDQARAELRAAVGALPERDWDRPSAGTSWTNAALLLHVAEGLGRLPQAIDAVRVGKNFMSPPAWAMRMLHPLQYLMVRRGASGVTRADLLERYDAAHAATLAKLDEVREDEWERGARCYDAGYLTVEGLFQFMARHVRAHLGELARSA